MNNFSLSELCINIIINDKLQSESEQVSDLSDHLSKADELATQRAEKITTLTADLATANAQLQGQNSVLTEQLATSKSRHPSERP